MSGNQPQKQPTTAPVMLEPSQREITRQLSSIIVQLSAVIDRLERQSDSTFNDRSWASESWPEFPDIVLLDLPLRQRAGLQPFGQVDQCLAVLDQLHLGILLLPLRQLAEGGLLTGYERTHTNESEPS